MTDSPIDLRAYTSLQDRVLTALGQQLTDMNRDLGRRLDAIADDNKEFGQRLSRIEGMQVGNAAEIKDVKEDLKGAKSDAKTANEKVSKLENRIVRLETMIVPAVALVSTAASSILGHFVK